MLDCPELHQGRVTATPAGMNFSDMAETSEELRDSGTFCPDAASNDGFGRGVRWGLFMAGSDKHRTNYFLRWELDMRANGARGRDRDQVT